MALEGISEMLKGVLEGVVLQIISQGEAYGYEILRRLGQIGLDSTVEGTVYTVLLRLERNGLVRTEKRPSPLGPPRKFYMLNQAGQRQLDAFWQRWHFLLGIMEKLEPQSKGDA